MKTSNFKYYKGDNGVAICLFPPIDWSGARFPSLAPNRQTFYEIKAGKINQMEYEKRYREEVLSKLDANEIYKQLKNNVLLCWENPGEFCHRRIVADWIQEELGIEVSEWKPEDEKLNKNINPLF